MPFNLTISRPSGAVRGVGQRQTTLGISTFTPLRSTAIVLESPARSASAWHEARQNERGREIVSRDGKPYLTQLKANSPTRPALSIMDRPGGRHKALSPASTYFFLLDGGEESLEYAQWLTIAGRGGRKHPKRLIARLRSDAGQRQGSG